MKVFGQVDLKNAASVHGGLTSGGLQYPAEDERTQLLRGAVLPTAREHGLSLALMIGVRRSVNPALRSAGDVGRQGRHDSSGTYVRGISRRQISGYISLARKSTRTLCVAARSSIT